MNNHGDLVGDFSDNVRNNTGLSTSHGFVLHDGMFTRLYTPTGVESVPQGLDLFPRDINYRGEIVGSVRPFSGSPGAATGFWLDAHGAFTLLSTGPEGALAGINNAGTIVGWAAALGPSAGALRFDKGIGGIVEIPGVISPTPQAINERGVIVGLGLDEQFVRRNFVYDRGVTSFVEVPNAPNAGIVGINARGELVGNYSDGSGLSRAFVMFNR